MAAINTAWVSKLKQGVEAVPDCQSLDAMVPHIQGLMDTQIAAARAQIAALTPMVVVPTNLSSVISFITKQIAFYELQLAQAVAAEAALVAAYSELLGALAAKKASLSCSVSLPPPPTP